MPYNYPSQQFRFRREMVLTYNYSLLAYLTIVMLKILGTTLHNFILLACIMPHIRMHSIRKHCDPAQMASPEASGSGSTMFSKKDKFEFGRIRVKSSN